MSTTHRGLPPPSAMALPDPTRPPPMNPSLGSLGSMPAPPNQWQGQEESMRNWLSAKAEEDKRKQEEEKTRQESYRLEQRRIEQSMLRESLQAGVPPSMVPMIYAGIGGANLANISMNWLQQYASQLQASQQQVQQPQPSPDLRRETRLISQANSYGPPPPAGSTPVISHQPPPGEQPPRPAPLQTTFPVYPPTNNPAPTSVPRSATHTQLPRLTTNEMYVQPQPSSQNPGSAHPSQSNRITQEPSTSSPIYFHHWVPPNESKSTQPQTPASKGEPLSAHPGSHLSESDYKDSPRKRKAQGGHQANPPPSAGPQYASPSFSTISSTSRKGTGNSHRRSRSNTSMKDSDSRPESRRDPEPMRSNPDSGQLSDARTGRSSTDPQREHYSDARDTRADER